MFVSKNEDLNKIKDKIYYALKEKFPNYRFSMKYIAKSDKQEWDWMIVNILTKGIKENDLREIDQICYNLQKMRDNKIATNKGLVDYIEAEHDSNPINQLNFE